MVSRSMLGARAGIPTMLMSATYAGGLIRLLNSTKTRPIAAAAFFCTTNRGKLLQHKLIRVQCTKKSTRVPVSPVAQYGYSILKII